MSESLVLILIGRESGVRFLNQPQVSNAKQKQVQISFVISGSIFFEFLFLRLRLASKFIYHELFENALQTGAIDPSPKWRPKIQIR